MNDKQIREELTQLILEHCEGDYKKIQTFEEKSITDDFGLDSVSLMALLVDIEEKFGINFDTTDNLLELLDNFNDLYCYICNIMGEGK